MSEPKYYVIYSGEDGLSIKEKTAEILIRDLNNEAADAADDEGCFISRKLESFPKDGEMPVYSTLIIKGEIVVPAPVEVVKSFRLP